MAMDRSLFSLGKGSWLNSMGMASTFVSRYGYTEDSVNRGCSAFGVCAGSRSGIGRGGSAVRAARPAKLVSVDGRVLSPILLHCQHQVSEMTLEKEVRLTSILRALRASQTRE